MGFAENYGLNIPKYGLISYLNIEVFFNYMAGEETFRKIHKYTFKLKQLSRITDNSVVEVTRNSAPKLLLTDETVNRTANVR